MTEIQELHKEIATYLKSKYGIDEITFEDVEDVPDKEIKFQLKPNCDGTKIKESLHKHFGDKLMFHATDMGGILGILIEVNTLN